MRNILRVVAVVLVGCAGSFFQPAWSADAEGKSGSQFEVRRVASAASGAKTEALPWVKAPTGEEKELQVEKEVLLRQQHIAKAEVEKDAITGRDEIKVTLTKEGAERFSTVTKNSVGKRLAIVVQGKIVSAPMINSEIGGGMFVITGNFSASEAGELLNALTPPK